MFRFLVAIALACVVSAGAALGQQDRAIQVPNSDAEMRAAIGKARAGLPQFWETLAHPHPAENGFALKVRITEGERTEHLWANRIMRLDDKIFGTIADQPEAVGSVKLGQRFEFTEADISDWMFRRHGKIIGNETMRVLLKYMPAGEAERFRALLADP